MTTWGPARSGVNLPQPRGFWHEPFTPGNPKILQVTGDAPIITMMKPWSLLISIDIKSTYFHHVSLSGWWFGTFFSHIFEIVNPYFRGVGIPPTSYWFSPSWLSSGVGHDAMSAVEKVGHWDFSAQNGDLNIKHGDLTICNHWRMDLGLKMVYTS